MTRGQELLRQRLKDRLTGRNGILAELRVSIEEMPAETFITMQPMNVGLRLILALNAGKTEDEAWALAKEINETTWADSVLAVAKIVEVHSNEFIDKTATEIEDIAKILVASELLEQVISSRELAERWPWTTDPNIAHGALSALLRETNRQREIRNLSEWPSEVNSQDILNWNTHKLTISAPRSARSLKLTLEHVQKEESKGGALSIWGMPFNSTVIPIAALAWLYHTEKTLKSVMPAAPTGCPLDVQGPAVRVASVLSGGHPAKLWEAEAKPIGACEDMPSGVRFTWADGEVEQLDLFVGTDGIDSPLLAVARKYGQAAVRDLLGIYFLTFARGASADELIWWWPDEHLGVMGRKPTKENKVDLIKRMDAMQRTRLEVQYPKGRPLKGPLVAFTATDTVARQIKLHPALYKGIKHEDGSLGTWWWWGPLELLAMPADRGAGRVHTLAIVAGHFWRSSLKGGEIKPAKVKAGRLADYLGIQGRVGEKGKNYITDTNAARTLHTTLEAAKEAGSLGHWEIVHGRLEDLSAVLALHPSAEALALANGTRRIERPAPVPATGSELAAWIKRAGQTATEAGELIKVAGSTMRRATTYGSRPLPDNVRRALRRYLWKGFGS